MEPDRTAGEESYVTSALAISFRARQAPTAAVPVAAAESLRQNRRSLEIRRTVIRASVSAVEQARRFPKIPQMEMGQTESTLPASPQSRVVPSRILAETGIIEKTPVC